MAAKITFDLASGKIIVEGEGDDLMKLAQAAKSLAPHLSEIRVISKPISPVAAFSTVSTGDPTVKITGSRKPSIRDFGKSLSLANTYERIAALAYHAIKIQQKQYFSVKEMDDWFGLCGFKKPTMIAVGLSDAKRRYGYVVSKGRDQWTITTGGENLIIEKLEANRG